MNTTAPTTKNRYFTDGNGIWKFPEKGAPKYRYPNEDVWRPSGFGSFAAFQQSPGDTREIDAKEGEKVTV